MVRAEHAAGSKLQPMIETDLLAILSMPADVLFLPVLRLPFHHLKRTSPAFWANPAIHNISLSVALMLVAPMCFCRESEAATIKTHNAM